MRALILAFAVVAIGLGASSLPAAAQSETPAAAETYTLDPAHTQVAFSIERFGFNHVLGRFDAIAGDVSLDQANPEQSSVNVTIQTASISAGDAGHHQHADRPQAQIPDSSRLDQAGLDRSVSSPSQ
jgi:polyisoprenoid-binding protein YceI